jgi:sugar/nucleoside kinase (ribokinase family)
VLVAGHICLDIILSSKEEVLLTPGSLREVGPAGLSPGGAVSNVGTSLSRLGIKTGMVGKIGGDPFGRILVDQLTENAPDAHQAISIDEREFTSYTIVVDLKDQDRAFLHAPGANRSFRSGDVSDRALASTRLLHFGYPPLMEAIYQNDGRELADLFARAKRSNVITSLDLSLPDALAPSGRVDWQRFLGQVLPETDYFLPSFDELAFMLDRTLFEETRNAKPQRIQIESLVAATKDLGAKNVGLKLGNQGFFFSDAWGVQIWEPCFGVDNPATTGSGDATIAGFLSGVIREVSLADSLKLACATGARCCERPDAVSGVKDLAHVLEKMNEPQKIP